MLLAIPPRGIDLSTASGPPVDNLWIISRGAALVAAIRCPPLNSVLSSDKANPPPCKVGGMVGGVRLD